MSEKTLLELVTDLNKTLRKLGRRPPCSRTAVHIYRIGGDTCLWCGHKEEKHEQQDQPQKEPAAPAE
jgi:hypothetical protein